MIVPIVLLLLPLPTVLLLYILFREKEWKNAPPGPKGIPLLGNALQLSQKHHHTYSKWADEFGPLFRIKVGPANMVVCSDHTVLKEMLSLDAFCGRVPLRAFDWINNGKQHGILHVDGEQWEEIRRFVVRQMREFGFGKNIMEESIMMDVKEVIESLKKDEGTPIRNVRPRFQIPVTNSLWNITAGVRFPHEDTALSDVGEQTNVAFETVRGNAGFAVAMPRLAKAFPRLTGCNTWKALTPIFDQMFRPYVQEHYQSMTEDYDRDFVDVFLKEVKKTVDPKSVFYKKFGEDNLVATMCELFFAGSISTSTTLTWLFRFLSKNPEAQRKLQAEIEGITGNTRPCCLEDRRNMPYALAVVDEVFRHSSVGPQAFQHRCTEDTTFHGYFIPKDTLVTPNLYHIHHNKQVWGDPQNFRPERFLTEDGSFKKHEAVMPFSIGKRQCIGETMARANVFLFATNICQRFDVHVDPDLLDHGLQQNSALIPEPMPFGIIFKDRLA